MIAFRQVCPQRIPNCARGGGKYDAVFAKRQSYQDRLTWIGLSLVVLMTGSCSSKLEVQTERGARSNVSISNIRSPRAHTSPQLPLSAQAGDSWVHPKTGIELVFIPEGKFEMGDDDIRSISDNNPRHAVRMSGFWISRTLVTVEQYMMFLTCSPSQDRPKPPSFNADWSKLDHPIVNVSAKDADAFCAWAVLQLPTEAQWEKAARGSDGSRFPWGGADPDPSKLWYGQIASVGTCSVRKFKHGPYELFDMAGNIWQWCRDTYDREFWKDRPKGEVDPVNTQPGTLRVLRGGSWLSTGQQYFRSAYRGSGELNYWDFNWGFRVVMKG